MYLKTWFILMKYNELHIKKVANISEADNLLILSRKIQEKKNKNKNIGGFGSISNILRISKT